MGMESLLTPPGPVKRVGGGGEIKYWSLHMFSPVVRLPPQFCLSIACGCMAVKMVASRCAHPLKSTDRFGAAFGISTLIVIG